MVDRAELRRLAEAARELDPLDDDEITRACDGNSSAHTRVMRPYLCVIKDPDVVLGLLEEIERTCDYDIQKAAATRTMEIAKDLLDERDQLRAVAVRLKGVLVNISQNMMTIHGAHGLCFNVLTDPEVEKL